MTADMPLTELIRNLCNTLDYLKASGCTGFDCSRKGLDALARLGADSPLAGPMGESLVDVRDDLGACTRCPLSRERTHIVFGEGAEHARLVLVGEGPGFEEDRSGRPFVGAAGALLDKIIAAMGLTRQAVYIGNIVKCRPPGNRNPTPAEIAACLPFLKRQLAAIRPRVICALGGVAAHSLLETEIPISRLRGRFHEVMGMAVMPTFHPAFLLRNPDRKRDVWHDMQLVMKRLDNI
jgi:DNA polymerase